MKTITIDGLPKAENLTSGDIIPINQSDNTRKVELETLQDFIIKAETDPIYMADKPSIALKAELIAHNESLTAHENRFSETNGSLYDLRKDFNAWIGRGGYLDPFDFGTSTPTQQQLSDQALSQITSINNHLQIWNGTKIINSYDRQLWILTNTQNTDPPIFEWTGQGALDLAPFDINVGGYIVGANETDPPEYVQRVSLSNGKGKVDLEAIKNLIFDEEHPIGDVVAQYPGTASPLEKNWRGTWELWNDRAMLYRLTQTEIPAHTVYQPSANYAINAVVMWHLDGDDWAFFRANREITSAAEQLDPVMWDQVKTGEVIERRHILDINPWDESDLEIGSQISGGQHDGYFVEEIIVFGGKFFSNAGGNRPPFVTGGVQGDGIREIVGSFLNSTIMAHSKTAGAFEELMSDGLSFQGYTFIGSSVNFSAARVVPTGPENSPRALSMNWYLRIS